MNIVEKITEGVDPRDVAATVYQMRNPFKQFADGVASELDVHCYFQHAYAADLVRSGDRVLDLCCGRGLLIPFLRYRASKPSVYVGVDIEPKNARWAQGRDPRREASQAPDWGFPTLFVEGSVAETSKLLSKAKIDAGFDVVVYTSSIEHMQPEWQARSLKEAGKVTRVGGVLYLTCPVTEAGRSGYDAQYPAHVYEPTHKELSGWLESAGWKVKTVAGVSTKWRHLQAKLPKDDGRWKMINYLRSRMPREQALPTIACVYPDLATEVSYLCYRATDE